MTTFTAKQHGRLAEHYYQRSQRLAIAAKVRHATPQDKRDFAAMHAKTMHHQLQAQALGNRDRLWRNFDTAAWLEAAECMRDKAAWQESAEWCDVCDVHFNFCRCGEEYEAEGCDWCQKCRTEVGRGTCHACRIEARAQRAYVRA